MSAGPTRRNSRRQHQLFALELPSARYGVASVVAVAGTGRLRRLARSLAEPPLVQPDPYGCVAALEAGLDTLGAESVS